MDSNNNLSMEERIQRLEDIESIRYLQSKYQRCLDTRDFDGLSECFADDIVSDYGNGSMAYEGKENVLGFLIEVMTLKMPSSHLIHGGEIDLLDKNSARAKWYLEDYLLHRSYKMKIHGAAVYDVDYRKENGRWVITKIGYKRQYEYVERRTLMNLFTLKKTTFLDAKEREDLSKLGTYNQRFYNRHIAKKKRADKKK